MGKFSRIFHHITVEDVKNKWSDSLEESIARQFKEDEEKRIVNELVDEIKSDWKSELSDLWKQDWRDKLNEGMTTQVLTGILPSTGDSDLETVNLGVSGGHAPVNYGTNLANSEEDPNTIPAGTEYTALTNLEPMNTVVRGNESEWVDEYYWLVGTFDQENQHWTGHRNGGSGGSYSYLVPGFKEHTMRNVQLSGAHRNRAVDDDPPGGYHPTSTFGSNDEVGQPYTSSSNATQGAGVVLNFNGPGSPRFIALKPVDGTQVDTLKVHGLVADTNLTRAGAHSSVECRPQLYYWAGDHPDFKKSFVNGSLAKTQPSNTHVVRSDGWRPINMKPNGDIDPSVDPFIIKYREDEDATGNKNRAPGYVPQRYDPVTDSILPPIYSAGHMRVYPYSIKLPEWTNVKNARFMIFQRFTGSISGNTFSVSGVRYQRKSNMKIPALTKPLTDIETSPFVRVGAGKESLGAKERKKKVKDIIDGGLKYTETKFSKDFPVRTTLESKLFEKLKDRKILKEGMTTQVLTGILPSAGNTDLDMLQLGATGSDLSYVDGADSPVDGEFTALVNTDPITSVDDPLSVGTNIRSPQNGASLSLDFTDSDAFHTHTDPGDSVPGDDGGTRGSGISGNYNSGYVNDEGSTNENIPFNDFNGEYLPTRVGTHLAFGNHTRLANAGFPRYAALKAVDTTEFDTLSMNWFCRGTVNIDTVDGSPTQGEKVVGGSTTKFNTAGDGVSVFYWAGDKEGAATYAPSVTGQSGIHDGWRPINVKPDGTTDNSYSPWLITHKADVATYGSGSRQKHDSGYPAEVLLNNKITLPPWCRDKNTRFLLHQGRNAAGAHRANFGITSVRFQRRSTMRVRSLMKPLSDVESSPFVRVGPTKKNEGGKERKKKVQDIIRSGLKYTGKKFSKDFPVRTDLE